jgi:hypothetical protein
MATGSRSLENGHNQRTFPVKSPGKLQIKIPRVDPVNLKPKRLGPVNAWKFFLWNICRVVPHQSIHPRGLSIISKRQIGTDCKARLVLGTNLALSGVRHFVSDFPQLFLENIFSKEKNFHYPSYWQDLIFLNLQ